MPSKMMFDSPFSEDTKPPQDQAPSEGTMADLQECILNTSLNLLRIWKSFNFSDEEIKSRQHRFRKHIKELLWDMEQEVAEKLESTEKELGNLTFEINELQQDLGSTDTIVLESALQNRDMDENISLVQKVTKLGKIKEKLQNEKNALLAAVNEYREEISALCQEIKEYKPDLNKYKDLTMKEQIEKLKKIKAELEERKESNIAKIQLLQRTISRGLAQLKEKPESYLNHRMLKSNSAPPTPDTITKLETMLTVINKEVENMRNKASTIFSELQTLWKLLGTDSGIINDVTSYYNSAAPIASTVPMLEIELARCNEEKADKIELILLRLGEDLQSLWEFSCCDSSECTKFLSNIEALSVDDQVVAHEEEIQRLRSHASANKEIFNSVRNYLTLWEKWTEFELKATNDPQRLENRGGYLLAQEKKRKELVRSIKTLERTILAHAENYKNSAENSAAQFVVYGKSVQDWFKMLSDNLEAQKVKEKVEKTILNETTLPVSDKRKRTRSPGSSYSNVSGLHRSATWGPTGKRERTGERSIVQLNSRVLPAKNVAILRCRSAAGSGKGSQGKPPAAPSVLAVRKKRKSARHSIGTPERLRKNDLRSTVQLKSMPLKNPTLETVDFNFGKLSINDSVRSTTGGVFAFGPVHTSTPLVNKPPERVVPSAPSTSIVKEEIESDGSLV